MPPNRCWRRSEPILVADDDRAADSGIFFGDGFLTKNSDTFQNPCASRPATMLRRTSI